MDLLTQVSDFIWNPPAYFALAVGAFFTFITRGVQFRRLPDMTRHFRQSKTDDGSLSSFQTLALTLSSRVGVGGTRRVVQVAQTVVPFMAVGYLLVAAVLIGANISEVPEALRVIVMAGMGADQLFGGLVGFAVAWGVRRAVFASATGFGEGTFSAAAADATHPGKQGIIQAFSIYIDLFLICTATGLMIILTDSYNVTDPDGGFIVEFAPGMVAGPNYVQQAIDTTFGGFGSIFVALAVLLFAFTSQVFFFYVATTNLIFLLGEKSNRFLEGIIKVGALAISFIGAVISADAIWAAGDIGYALLAWMNMFTVLLLTTVMRKIVRDYDAQRKAGADPVFDPGKLDIKGAEWWETVFRERMEEREDEDPGKQPSPR